MNLIIGVMAVQQHNYITSGAIMVVVLSVNHACLRCNEMVGKIVSTFKLIFTLLFSKVPAYSDFFLLQDSCRPLFRQINGLDFLMALTCSLLMMDEP